MAIFTATPAALYDPDLDGLASHNYDSPFDAVPQTRCFDYGGAIYGVYLSNEAGGFGSYGWTVSKSTDAGVTWTITDHIDFSPATGVPAGYWTWTVHRVADVLYCLSDEAVAGSATGWKLRIYKFNLATETFAATYNSDLTASTISGNTGYANGSVVRGTQIFIAGSNTALNASASYYSIYETTSDTFSATWQTLVTSESFIQYRFTACLDSSANRIHVFAVEPSAAYFKHVSIESDNTVNAVQDLSSLFTSYEIDGNFQTQWFGCAVCNGVISGIISYPTSGFVDFDIIEVYATSGAAPTWAIRVIRTGTTGDQYDAWRGVPHVSGTTLYCIYRRYLAPSGFDGGIYYAVKSGASWVNQDTHAYDYGVNPPPFYDSTYFRTVTHFSIHEGGTGPQGWNPLLTAGVRPTGFTFNCVFYLPYASTCCCADFAFT